MAIQVSPSVIVQEIDRTNTIPALATSVGGYAGAFKWGPVSEIVSISNERSLIETFGAPDDNSFKHFYLASQFLSYGNQLRVVRIESGSLRNSVSNPQLDNGNEIVNDVVINNETDYTTKTEVNFEGNFFAARFPGSIGNSLEVLVVPEGYYSVVSADEDYGVYKNSFFDPGENELHILVLDKDGTWSGQKGTILESFIGLSTLPTARNSDGTSNYYKKVIQNRSSYIWAGVDLDITESTPKEIGDIVFGFSGGADYSNWETGDGSELGDLKQGYDLFRDTETININLLIGPQFNVGNTTTSSDVVMANYLIGLVESRKDLVVTLSPSIERTVNKTNSQATSNVIAWANALQSSSYAFLDSSALYIYDKYNDTYRWVCASGATAGLMALTDLVADPWFSPAGFNRGQLRNVVKLSFNPNQANRDDLYSASVNPITSIPGQGIVLFGDKTGLKRPSFFDRINVRRLFITIEKAIGESAKFYLFEFNDPFTRGQFVSSVEPFLRDVQGRRGITDFRVVCDESNNTEEVINQKRFVADIYVRPNLSVNFIRLNFIGVRNTVDFSEIAG
jgi:hypothetical protein